MNRPALALAGLATISLSAGAVAQVTEVAPLLQSDFSVDASADNLVDNFDFPFTFAEQTAPAVTDFGRDDGTLRLDVTGFGPNVGSFGGIGLGVGGFQLPTSGDAADYNLSADVTGDTGTVDLVIEFRRPQGGPGDNTDNLDFNGDFDFVGAFVTPVDLSSGSASINTTLADATALIFESGRIDEVTSVVAILRADAQTGDASNFIALDNLLLTGPTVVPEPASLGLLAIGGLAMLRRRR